jgi:hypothetical protein
MDACYFYFDGMAYIHSMNVLGCTEKGGYIETIMCERTPPQFDFASQTVIKA